MWGLRAREGPTEETSGAGIWTGSASDGCAYSPGEYHVGGLEGPEERAFANVGAANWGRNDWAPMEASGIQWLSVLVDSIWRGGHGWDDAWYDGEKYGV